MSKSAIILLTSLIGSSCGQPTHFDSENSHKLINALREHYVSIGKKEISQNIFSRPIKGGAIVVVTTKDVKLEEVEALALSLKTKFHLSEIDVVYEIAENIQNSGN